MFKKITSPILVSKNTENGSLGVWTRSIENYTIQFSKLSKKTLKRTLSPGCPRSCDTLFSEERRYYNVVDHDCSLSKSTQLLLLKICLSNPAHFVGNLIKYFIIFYEFFTLTIYIPSIKANMVCNIFKDVPWSL